MAISLTASAAERVRSQLSRRGSGLGLRLGIKSSGCSGFSYVIDFADEARADDLVFDSHGVKVFVDRTSLPAIDGGFRAPGAQRELSLRQSQCAR